MILHQGFCQARQLLGVDVFLTESNFFRAGNHEPLAMLNRLNILAGFKERLISSSVQPSITASP